MQSIAQPNNLTLLLLLTILISSTSSTQIQTHPSDIQSLKSLKSSLTTQLIPGSCLASWNFSYDPCASASSDHFTCGIRCDLIDPSSHYARITDLSLDPAGYSGTLSPSSLNLPFLQTLSLSDNFLSGPLPHSIFSNLTKLQKLVLSRNSFSGSLPESISTLTGLQELCLDNNGFNGSVFTKLGKLVSLRRLEIQRNRFSGTLSEINSLISLYFLDASDNQLVGAISTSNLPNSLVELSLRNNSFSSVTFSDLPFLQVLDLSHNKLSGTVSINFFIHRSLQQLTLSHNNLSSIQTPSKTFNPNTTCLVSLDLSHNALQGQLPEFLPQLPALSSLSLEQNMLTGPIPSNYAKRAAAESGDETTSFGRLLLGGNYLYGLIPGPLTSIKAGRVNVSLVDNCLYSCPISFFFCQGGNQKSMIDCNRFRHFNINKNKN